MKRIVCLSLLLLILAALLASCVTYFPADPGTGTEEQTGETAAIGENETTQEPDSGVPNDPDDGYTKRY